MCRWFGDATNPRFSHLIIVQGIFGRNNVCRRLNHLLLTLTVLNLFGDLWRHLLLLLRGHGLYWWRYVNESSFGTPVSAWRLKEFIVCMMLMLSEEGILYHLVQILVFKGPFRGMVGGRYWHYALDRLSKNRVILIPARYSHGSYGFAKKHPILVLIGFLNWEV